ncbi:hypothetical protein Pint_17111 [Pistacia integerrima]|uniref:Uncharacterized protein n=1 Tax=Pistacia integerrima TaxID=434235 RepID=A0ACC0YTY9_9ROSI|nr:hypothetical protein Pint_17111 [Pistacia integerrima]
MEESLSKGGPKRGDREPFAITSGACGLCARVPPPVLRWVSVVRANAWAGWAVLHINKPRCESRQGNLNERARSYHPGHSMRGFLSLSKTTLGNGYLSSRINEERSKMLILSVNYRIP